MRTTIWSWAAKNYWRFSPINLYEKFARTRFDRKYGCDTQTDVQLAQLSIDSPNRSRGKRYHATPPMSFKRVLRRLGIDFADYTFVDIGSGKGRTLLLASDLAFKNIVGVEFGAELHAQAVRNIRQYPSRSGAAVESVHMDATKFVFPDGPLVLYFFNPFDGEVLRQVLANITRAAEQQRRPIFIVYLYLEDAEIFSQFKNIRPHFSWHRFDVFTCHPS